MSNPRPTHRLTLLLLLLLCAGFAAGLGQLFKLRFEAGDVYPPYSSLRADPLGTMAFCESLEKIPSLTVRRDFSSNNRLPGEKNTTYLHLAARVSDWHWLPREVVDEIDGFVARGGRLTVTFLPETAKPFRSYSANTNRAESARRKNSPSGRKSESARSAATNNPPETMRPATGKSQQDRAVQTNQPPQVEDVPGLREISLKQRWGLDFAFLPLASGQAGAHQPASVHNDTNLPLPETLDWHSSTVFANLDKAWRTIYARGSNPVVIERKFGAGAIVMATDSYFLSNEALLKDRHAQLLAWLVGPAKHVVFDEAHLGLTETPGIAVLIRKYRLHGLAAGLALLAGLFLWKNALSFVPPHPDETRQDYVMGKEAAAGFTNLLRRNVAPRDLLGTCFGEWKKSCDHNPRAAARMAQAQAVLQAEEQRPSRQRDPVRAYQEIYRTINASAPPGSPPLTTKSPVRR